MQFSVWNETVNYYKNDFVFFFILLKIIWNKPETIDLFYQN